MLAEYAPLIAAAAAIIVAALAWLSSRRKPAVDAATADKIRTEIAKDREATQLDRARADAKRDRHIVRLETWGFEIVRPWSRRASVIIDEQNELLVELAARGDIPFTPRHLEPLVEMPQINDEG